MSERVSLRALVTAVVLGVALLPVPTVALLGALGESREAAVQRAVGDAVREADEALSRGERPGALAPRLARRHRVRLRVLDPHGAPLADADHDPRVARYAAVASSSPDPRALDAFLQEPGALAQSPAAQGLRIRCGAREGGALWACEASITRGGVTAHALRSSASEARRLSAYPRPLAWLTAFVALTGVALAAWLLARIVRPLDALRAALATRAERPRLATQPVTLDAPPEVQDVVRAHNQVLAALESERRAKESLASFLVHEIKGPLAAIRMALEPHAPQAAGALDAARRIDRTVGLLLELSRAEAGLPDAPRESVPLRTFAEGVAETSSPPEGVSLRVEGDDAQVMAAPEPLERALRCLVENAVSFARAEVTLRVSRDAQRALLAVDDDGPGVDPALLPRLFERFVSARRDRGGTGLGLAHARAVAEAHGGSLRVENRAEGGARFTLALPLAGSHTIHTGSTPG
ncbi:MAG: HAMP domain-containing sensor histidine kinase [Polyangiales bacterium]